MKELCEILLAEMEVWWEVVPVKFIVEPPVIPLYYSRRYVWCDTICTIQTLIYNVTVFSDVKALHVL